MIGKLFPSATRNYHMEALVKEKSLAATLRWRLSEKEALPTLASGEWVLHQEFFVEGSGSCCIALCEGSSSSMGANCIT